MKLWGWTASIIVALIPLTTLGDSALCQVATTPLSLLPVIATGFSRPDGPALDRDGSTLYLVNVNGSEISRVNLSTGHRDYQWATLPRAGRGRGLTIGPDGALYVADIGNKSIERIDTRSGSVSTYADSNQSGEPLRAPIDLCFDKAGGLYFTDRDELLRQSTGTVYYVAAGTHEVSVAISGLLAPDGVTISPDQNTLYVAESLKSRVLAYAIDTPGAIRSGSSRVFATTGAPGEPHGIHADKAGNVYICECGDGVIDEFSPEGSLLRELPVSNGQDDTNLCFSHDGRSLYVTESTSNSLLLLKLPR